MRQSWQGVVCGEIRGCDPRGWRRCLSGKGNHSVEIAGQNSISRPDLGAGIALEPLSIQPVLALEVADPTFGAGSPAISEPPVSGCLHRSPQRGYSPTRPARLAMLEERPGDGAV